MILVWTDSATLIAPGERCRRAWSLIFVAPVGWVDQARTSSSRVDMMQTTGSLPRLSTGDEGKRMCFSNGGADVRLSLLPRIYRLA